MNDDDVVSRVRSAVEAQVSGVSETPPELVPRYDTPVTEIRSRRSLRWALPAGLAAAAAVVLGAVLATRGDNPRDLDVAATTTPETTTVLAPAPLERWVLQLDETSLTGAEEATTSSTAIGTTVYYAAAGGRNAAVRTNGASPLLTRSSWPEVSTLPVLGVTATRYADGVTELLVIPTDPPLTIETYGGWSAAARAASAKLVDGVWEIDATEIGRRSPEDLGLHYSSLQYRSGGHQYMVSVVDHPGGTGGFLIDAGYVSATRRVVNGMTFAQIDPGSWVLLRDAGPAVNILDSSPDGPSDEVLASLHQVSDAEWRALVAPIRPDLATPGGTAPPSTTIPATPFGLYRAIGTVIEVPGKSLELCLGDVEESLPPQCDGITVSPPEWRWPEGTFQTSADGTRWAEYYVEGTYDGTTFTATDDPRVPTPNDRAQFPQTAIDLTTPCPVPAGGWLAVAANAPTDPAALEALTTAAAAERDYVGLWLDQSINPAAGSQSPTTEGAMNDPTKLIVNVAFTGDVARHQSELSELWPGALCVVQSSGKSEAELRSIQDSLPSMSPDFLSSEIDVTRGVIVARFVVVPQYLQDGLDTKYGTGTVIAESALQLVLVVD